MINVHSTIRQLTKEVSCSYAVQKHKNHVGFYWQCYFNGNSLKGLSTLALSTFHCTEQCMEQAVFWGFTTEVLGEGQFFSVNSIVRALMKQD